MDTFISDFQLEQIWETRAGYAQKAGHTLPLDGITAYSNLGLFCDNLVSRWASVYPACFQLMASFLSCLSPIYPASSRSALVAGGGGVLSIGLYLLAASTWNNSTSKLMKSALAYHPSFAKHPLYGGLWAIRSDV
jgi:hypothetical protein